MAFFTAYCSQPSPHIIPQSKSQWVDLSVLILDIWEKIDLNLSYANPLISSKEETSVGKKLKPIIVVHGGAGVWSSQSNQPALEKVKRAAKMGFDILKKGGDALDSVTEAVAVMEEDGSFNAGYGSALNLERRIEMEASASAR